ncbi:sulfotransferase family protein [Shewanella ulleungensis]|uniref:Sulfotransferase family protein n=1 Tax=Shewanella ulleungensis TaxID=2282699 RepID=A0ABQ2QJL6_9GAMM|nr:sulfotransferase family protein [Shewanella ulleungensis]MCL1149840.1 hypothetical protein [Shewanella ulleungensis]GGP84957.1 hypothetical protein GCM10009410_17640 [Shewanella ulleungensis]
MTVFTLILGMHRSGTSCLTGCLESAGLFLGDVVTEAKFNKRGNRENKKIVQLNDLLLAHNSASWSNPMDIVSWDMEHELARGSLISSYAMCDNYSVGIKDPRICFSLPFWLDGIEKYRFIGTFRHPHSVALSLNYRNNMPLDVAYDLWNKYNTKLLEYLRSYQFPLLCFDVENAKYLQDIESICSFLDLNKPSNSADFFESSLRNHNIGNEYINLPQNTTHIYNELLEYYNNQDIARNNIYTKGHQ